MVFASLEPALFQLISKIIAVDFLVKDDSPRDENISGSATNDVHFLRYISIHHNHMLIVCVF